MRQLQSEAEMGKAAGISASALLVKPSVTLSLHAPTSAASAFQAPNETIVFSAIKRLAAAARFSPILVPLLV